MCQPLDDLRDLAGSDSVDTFVLCYTSLLQVCPPALQLLCMSGLHSLLRPKALLPCLMQGTALTNATGAQDRLPRDRGLPSASGLLYVTCLAAKL